MKYLHFVRICILELLEYRTNFFVRGINYAMSLMFNLFFWLAVTKIRGHIFNYTTADIILYYIFLALVIPAVNAGSDFSQKIGLDIKNGDLSIILIKPVGTIRFYLAYALTQRLQDFLTMFPFALIVLLLFGYTPHFSLIQGFLLVISLFYAFLFSHLILGMVGLVAFWTTEINWASNFFMQVITLFSGSYFPLNFLAVPIVTIISATPFYFLFYYPTSILLNKYTNSEIVLVAPIIWLFGFILLFHRMWSRGLKRYEGVGR